MSISKIEEVRYWRLERISKYRVFGFPFPFIFKVKLS